jgi:hypothetical protein
MCHQESNSDPSVVQPVASHYTDFYKKIYGELQNLMTQTLGDFLTRDCKKTAVWFATVLELQCFKLVVSISLYAGVVEPSEQHTARIAFAYGLHSFQQQSYDNRKTRRSDLLMWSMSVCVSCPDE